MRRYLKPPPLAKGKVTRKDRKILSEADARKLAVVREPVGTGPAELIRHFLANRAPTTVKAYRADLDAFAEFLEVPSAEEALAALLVSRTNANRLALEWLSDMESQQLSTSTQARRICSLRSLLSLGRLVGMVDWELDVASPTVRLVRDVRGPSADDVSAIVGAFSDDLLGTRDKAVVLLAFTLGMRRSEICGLRVRDYNRERRKLFIRGKGDRHVWMSIPEPTADALDNWLCLSRGMFCNARACTDAQPDAPIFIRLDRGLDTSAKALSVDAVYDIVRRAGSIIGLRIWPHALRHSAITAALEATGGDLRRVKEFSRHRQISTVMRYDDACAEELGGRASDRVCSMLLRGSDDE